MIRRDLFVSPIKIKLPLTVANVSFSIFTLIQQDELMGWHLSELKAQEFELPRSISVTF